jgi:Fibronectin type III domain
MADLYSLRAQGLRASLIAVAVVALFGLKSFLTSTEEIRLSTEAEVEAGTELVFLVQAKPNSTVFFELLAPNQMLQNFELKTDDSGNGTLRVEGKNLSLAGPYEMTAKNKRGKASTETPFEVLAGAPALSQSRVSFSSAILRPDQTVQMSLTLKDAYKNPVSGHSITVNPSSPSAQVFSSDFMSNENGQINFTIMGSGEGVLELSFFDATRGETILAPAQLALTGGPRLDDSVQLAESGPVEAFVISELESETEVAEEQSVTVKAVDENGFTVQDYMGTIRFSSSDDQATLPNDYTFLAEDQGEHRFNLGVKFVTLGSQTLSVTDIDDIQVNGEKTTTVLSDENAPIDYNTDFETSDFEREGDFTLNSPASGMYSETTIEIQGTAEYGTTAVIFVNEEEAGRADVEFDNSFNYTLEDLEDGSYVIYVDIQDEEGTSLESSDSETLSIDTKAPELVSINADPDGTVEANSEVWITVLSEPGMDDASVIFEGEVSLLEETGTAGKYQALLIAPEKEGSYTVDVFLRDTLGNEVEFKDPLNLTVASVAEPATSEDANETPNESASPLSKVLGLVATGGDELIALTWQAPENAGSIAYYRVYYGPSPSALFAISETTDASTNWTIKNLIGNEYYYFAVTAVNFEGEESPASDTVLGIPKASKVVQEVPSYPVYTNLEQDVNQTPETGPATGGILLLSALGAMGSVLFRRRARG